MLSTISLSGFMVTIMNESDFRVTPLETYKILMLCYLSAATTSIMSLLALRLYGFMVTITQRFISATTDVFGFMILWL